MNDAHDAETDQATPYMRLPWPLVAVGLLGILAVVLAIGLFANRYLRPQVGLVPTPEPAAIAAAPLTSTPPAATSVPTPAPALVVQAPVSATATPLPAAAAPTQVPPAAVAPSARPTLDTLLVSEVSTAYEEYWRIRTQALLELDKTHLPEVMGGDHLNSIAHLVDELHAENRAIKTDVDHDSHVVQISGDSAQVVDDYISNSVYVDPVTKAALTESGSDELRVLYRMTRSNGTWRVVDSVRAE